VAELMPDYGLDGRVSIPGREKGFLCWLWVQTGSGAHPASYPMGTGGPFPLGKAWPRRVADNSAPSIAWDENE
jgi:hypothetical protein